MSVNKAILVGNLGKDPEFKETENSSICKFPLATSERYNDEDRTEWHNVILWGKLAEIASKHLVKGSQVYIEGKIQTRSYESDGVKKYTTEIVGRELKFIGKKPGAEQNTKPDPF